ncbi:hypothetical protein BX666DRAFT_2032191 [Dichotomocladium elegans]|nr:hypothetical protein BX666DRAFT_2032191 [Dichotomocladium elegans]
MVILKAHPCKQCGTTRYKKTPEGGMVCKYGHLLVGWQREVSEEMAWKGRARTKVLMKERKERDVLMGGEREAATIRIMQYGLQIVSRAFVCDLGFDRSFEVRFGMLRLCASDSTKFTQYVVRELWLLIVQKSGIYIPDKDTEFHASLPVDDKLDVSASQPNPDLIWGSLEDEFDFDAHSEDDNDYSEEDDGNYNDAMNNASGHERREQQPANRKTWPRPRYYDIMVFCYLACLWIRAPVLPSDIYRWCLSYKLPYFKVARMVPDDLVKRLEKMSLSTFTNIPTMSKIYDRILSYKRVLQYQTGLVFPEINVPPIMSRLCAQYYLPSEMYHWAQYILEKFPPHESMRMTRHNVHTEVRVMASIFILIKMLYILDDEQSEPVLNNEPIPDLVPRSEWRKLIKANLKRWQQCNEEEILGTETTDVALHSELSSDLSAFTEKQNHFVRRNAFRSRMKIARITEGIPPRPRIDLFMEPPNLQSAKSTGDKTTDQPAKTHEVGTSYLKSAIDGHFYSQLMWYDEYKSSLSLAGEILGIDPEHLFMEITRLEDGMIRIMREEDPEEINRYKQKKLEKEKHV